MAEYDDACGFLRAVLEKEGGFSRYKASSVSAQFSTLGTFYGADFKNIKLVRGGDRTEIVLSDRDRDGAQRVKKYIRPEATPREHWVRFAAERLIRKMAGGMQDMDLEKINVDPFLIKALNLKTPREVVKFGVYQTVSRSVAAGAETPLGCSVGGRGARIGKGERYDVVEEMMDLARRMQAGSGPDSKGRAGRFNGGLGRAEALEWIGDTASRVLRGRSVVQEIDEAVERITAEFEQRHGTGEKGVEKYLNSAL